MSCIDRPYTSVGGGRGDIDCPEASLKVPFLQKDKRAWSEINAEWRSNDEAMIEAEVSSPHVGPKAPAGVGVWRFSSQIAWGFASIQCEGSGSKSLISVGCPARFVEAFEGLSLSRSSRERSCGVHARIWSGLRRGRKWIRRLFAKGWGETNGCPGDGVCGARQRLRQIGSGLWF